MEEDILITTNPYTMPQEYCPATIGFSFNTTLPSAMFPWANRPEVTKLKVRITTIITIKKSGYKTRDRKHRQAATM